MLKCRNNNVSSVIYTFITFSISVHPKQIPVNSLKLKTLEACLQQMNWTRLNSSSEHAYSSGTVHTGSRRTELNWSKVTWTSWLSYTTRYWSRASAWRSWLYGCYVRELEFSSVQFICIEHALSITDRCKSSRWPAALTTFLSKFRDFSHQHTMTHFISQPKNRDFFNQIVKFRVHVPSFRQSWPNLICNIRPLIRPCCTLSRKMSPFCIPYSSSSSNHSSQNFQFRNTT